jgi:hypothetical protein
MPEIDKFYSVLKKQWIKELSLLKRARASTLDTALIYEFERQIKLAQELTFSQLEDGRTSGADVFVTTQEKINGNLLFNTIYLCPGTPTRLVSDLAKTLPISGVIVKYEILPPSDIRGAHTTLR